MKRVMFLFFVPLSLFANHNFCRFIGSVLYTAPDWLTVDYPVTNICWTHPEMPECETEEEYEALCVTGEYDPYPVTNVTYESRLVMNPSREDYISKGWMLNRVEPPALSNGYIAAFSHYSVYTNSGLPCVKASYRYYPEQPPVHTYKKSYLAQWFYINGKWNDFNALISASADAKFFWDTSTEFDSDHPQWNVILGGIVTGLGLTDAQKEEMLHYGETGI